MNEANGALKVQSSYPYRGPGIGGAEWGVASVRHASSRALFWRMCTLTRGAHAASPLLPRPLPNQSGVTGSLRSSGLCAGRSRSSGRRDSRAAWRTRPDSVCSRVVPRWHLPDVALSMIWPLTRLLLIRPQLWLVGTCELATSQFRRNISQSSWLSWMQVVCTTCSWVARTYEYYGETGQHLGAHPQERG